MNIWQATPQVDIRPMTGWVLVLKIANDLALFPFCEAGEPPNPGL